MTELPSTADAVVVGAGIAGAAAGDSLARAGLRVLVVEAEAAPGYHSTGRSAAQYYPTYGPPVVRALTAASRPLLADPPPDLVGGPLLRPRPVLTVAAPGDEDCVEAELAEARRTGTVLEAIDPGEAVALAPALRPELVAAAAVDRGAADLDVAGLHQLHLARLRRAGGTVATKARVTGLVRRGSGWRVQLAPGVPLVAAAAPPGTTSAGPTRDAGAAGNAAATATVDAAVVVDAAGAWGDELARLAGVRPLGLSPRRRTAFLVPAPPGSDGWPLVVDAAGGWYVKPDAGRLLCSPQDATPVPPSDPKPAEEDVARAIEAVNERTTLAIRSVVSAWAGLRTFAPDEVPVAGTDPEAPGFVWLVGQGGYGIKTAPALGELVTALVTGATPDLSPWVVEALAPARLRET